MVQQILDGLTAFFDKSGWFLSQLRALYYLLAGFYSILPEILCIVAGVIILFFGKKILPLGKFVLSFLIGFIAGFQFLAELLCGLISFEMSETVQLVIGCVCGLILALLFKVLYYLIVVGIAGGGAFYAGLMLVDAIPALSELAASQENMNIIIAAAVAVIVLIIALCLLKYLEMLVTSVIGAYAISFAVIRIYDYTALAEIGEPIALGPVSFAILELIVVGVLALIGWIVQIKTRRLY